MPLYRVEKQVILFVHIPKTGGSTIETWLQDLGPQALMWPGDAGEGLMLPPQHAHSALLQRIVPPDFYDDAFCIIRDPFERLLSEYRYLRKLHRAPYRKGITAFWPGRSLEDRHDLHFRKWVIRAFSAFKADPLTESNHIRPQSDFLAVEKCRVYRFEDGFKAILTDLAARWKMPRPDKIPHINETKKAHFEVDLKTRRLIDDFYSKDFERLGYARSATRT